MWFAERLQRIYRYRQQTLVTPDYEVGMRASPADWATAKQAYSASFLQIFPHLSQQASVFRNSEVSADHRQRQFQAFVAVLFSDAVPDDLRTSWAVSHFFSYWRLDQDYEGRNSSKLHTNGIPSQGVLSSEFQFCSKSSLPAVCETQQMLEHVPTFCKPSRSKGKRGGSCKLFT